MGSLRLPWHSHLLQLSIARKPLTPASPTYSASAVLTRCVDLEANRNDELAIDAAWTHIVAVYLNQPLTVELRLQLGA